MKHGGVNSAMAFDLRSLLPQILAPAIAWAEMQSGQAEHEGQNLSPAGLEIAKRAVVTRPELIRIKTADQLPLPAEPFLRQAAVETGLLGPGMVGLTLGCSILPFDANCLEAYMWKVNASTTPSPMPRIRRSSSVAWPNFEHSSLTLEGTT